MVVVRSAGLIERLRTKLLDLTTRNPLLNCRHSDRARAQVRIIDGLPDLLHGRLAEGKSSAFRALEEPDGTPPDEATDDLQTAFDGGRQGERHFDDEIQTLLFPDRMEAKLSAIRDGARRALEETGRDACFAADGFLEWYESGASEKPLCAPLLLQPLEMAQPLWHERGRGLAGMVKRR